MQRNPESLFGYWYGLKGLATIAVVLYAVIVVTIGDLFHRPTMSAVAEIRDERLWIKSLNDFSWHHCDVVINGTYHGRAGDFDPRERRHIWLHEIADSSGARFNRVTEKITELSISCNDAGDSSGQLVIDGDEILGLS